MPRIRLMDPMGMCYEIATRETPILKAWFDEVLPHTFVTGRPGIDDFEILWPKVSIYPMWAWKSCPAADPDWLLDNRVLGHMEELRARNGYDGIVELGRIRAAMEAELITLDAERASREPRPL